MIGLDSYSRQVFNYLDPSLIYQGFNRLPIWNSQNCSMFPLAFVAGVTVSFFPPRQSFPGEGSGRSISSPGKKLTSHFFPGEKKITSQFFPPPQNFQHQLYLVLELGKNCAGPLFLHTDRSKHLINISLGVGKNCCAYGTWGGEKLSQS